MHLWLERSINVRFWKRILKSHFEQVLGRNRAEFVQVQRRVESHRRFPLIDLRQARPRYRR